jgi:GH35 family endo-1,4-beta-xylanase
VPNIAQTNLLINSDFEESTDSVNGWWINAWGGASARVFTETGNDVIAGNVSAKVVVDTASDVIEKVSLMSDPISNVPKGDILITLYARTQTHEYLPFKVSLKCENSTGSKKWYGSETVLLTTSPQQFSFVLTPADDYRENILLRLSCGTNTGTFIFDNIFMGITNSDSLPIPSGRRLRKIVADKYPDGNVFIGGTTQGTLWGTISEKILNSEFNYITPANDFKQTQIHPEPGIYRWSDPDTWVQKAKQNNQVIRMHSPISPQCSKWAKEDYRTAEELLENLEEYVTAICQRYNDEENILWMDVVNETIDKNTGEWFGPKPGTDKWENPWTIIGFDTTDDGLNPPLYINRAFELANQYAPNIKQIINQHGTMNDAAWNKVKALVKYLRSKGRRVDGIGFQAHVDVGWENETNDNGVNNIIALGNLIDWVHANNLEFHITENNVFLRNGNEGKWEDQAETYKAILKTLLSKRNSGVVTWNTWMLRDNLGQAGDRTPSLFRKDGSPKPAYYAVQETLEDTTITNVKNDKRLQDKFVLFNNYPNPFNPITTIKYSIPLEEKRETVNIKLTVFDILGKEVVTLVNQKQKPGNYTTYFNAENLSSGIYYYQLKAGQFIKTKTMLLLK